MSDTSNSVQEIDAFVEQTVTQAIYDAAKELGVTLNSVTSTFQEEVAQPKAHVRWGANRTFVIQGRTPQEIPPGSLDGKGSATWSVWFSQPGRPIDAESLRAGARRCILGIIKVSTRFPDRPDREDR